MILESTTYGIALGSNLGDRLDNLKQAVAAILSSNPKVRLISAAPVYETEPVDCPEGSQSFYNTVIEVAAPFEPLEFLKKLRAIESKLGRPNEHCYHEPRTVDLDILYAGHVLMNHPDLVLPHPRMTNRRFVMEPLTAIRPSLLLPGCNVDVQVLHERLTTEEPPLKIIAGSGWTD
jgi:2-amino-4-hydroxy-6-hydroxymethyldihydropteridine diphosphokinase